MSRETSRKEKIGKAEARQITCHPIQHDLPLLPIELLNTAGEVIPATVSILGLEFIGFESDWCLLAQEDTGNNKKRRAR